MCRGRHRVENWVGEVQARGGVGRGGAEAAGRGGVGWGGGWLRTSLIVSYHSTNRFSGKPFLQLCYLYSLHREVLRKRRKMYKVAKTISPIKGGDEKMYKPPR